MNKPTRAEIREMQFTELEQLLASEYKLTGVYNTIGDIFELLDQWMEKVEDVYPCYQLFKAKENRYCSCHLIWGRKNLGVVTLARFRIFAHAETMPLAICRALLMVAYGYEEG